MRRALVAMVACFALPLVAGDCGGGDGSGGSPPRQRVSSAACFDGGAPLVGQFPPGFDMLPGDAGHAAAVQFDPAAVLFFDLDAERPKLLAQNAIFGIPPDTDGDGTPDEDQPLCDADPRMRSAVMGRPLGVSEDLAFVAASGFEEVMFVASPNGALETLRVSNPDTPPGGSHAPEDYPFLPAAGTSEARTALSTKACIYLTDEMGIDPFDSSGEPIGNDVCCDRIPGVPSYVTRFTSGMTLAGDSLFVAMSNLYRSSRAQFQPGTILVYDWDSSATPPELSPAADTPVIFTTGFNPTGMTSYTTSTGRELVVVTGTGAITLGVGPSGIITEGFLDFIDVATRRVVATIPLGLGAPSADGAAIHPSGRIAMLGSTSMLAVFAVDLSPLDDPALYPPSDVVVRLDGSDPSFPDARIFDADSPFELLDRDGGPNPIVCPGWTHVAINASGLDAYAIDRCDGTLAIIDLTIPDLACAPGGPSPGECCDSVPLPQGCFVLDRSENVTAPFNEPRELHGPSQILVRPGDPGLDYTSPDVYFLVDLPEGQLCSARIDSLSSAP